MMPDTATNCPSRWHYVIGAAVIGLGFILSLVILITSITNAFPDIRIVVPGTHELELESTGTYTIFYEYRSTVDGKKYLTGESLSTISGIDIRLESKGDAQQIPLENPFGSTSYTVGSRSGESLFEFDIDEPGEYILTAEYENDRTEPEVVFAIGQFDIWGTVLSFFGIGFAGFAIGAFIIIRAFIKRRNAGRQAQTA